MDKRYTLLRELMRLTDQQGGPVCYVLTQSLLREGILKLRSKLIQNNQPTPLYECIESGEVFAMPDLNLNRIQLYAAHKTIARLLRDRETESRIAETKRKNRKEAPPPVPVSPPSGTAKKNLLGCGAIAVVITLIVLTQGNIIIVAGGIFAFLMFGLMIWGFGHVTAEKLVGENPSWKAVAVGIVLVIFGLVLCAKSCRTGGYEDVDPADYGRQGRP